MSISTDTPVTTPADINAAERWLFEHPERLNPKALKDAATAWAHIVADRVGRDDGSRDLTPVLTSYVEMVNQRAPVGNARVILDALSEAVESQLPLATWLHNAVHHNRYAGHNKPLLRDDSYPEAGWIDNFGELVKFLKQPLTDQSAHRFELDQIQSFPGSKAKAFYQAFWSLSNDQHAAFLGKVIGMPTTRNPMAFLQAGQKLRTEIQLGLGREFLPPEKPQYGDDDAYAIGDKIVQAFFLAPPPAKMLMRCFASLLDAVHDDLCDQHSHQPRTRNADERFGYRLGKFMTNLGPGACKTAQFGHSLPTTPEAWEPGLAGSKSDAGSPSRYEYLSWVENRVPPQMRSHIIHIGAHKGTGSYLSTYGVELDAEYLKTSPTYTRHRDLYPEKNLVLSMKKPNARDDALEFSNYLLGLAGKIVAAHPSAEKSIAPLIELIKQGIGMVTQETDLNYSAQQEKVVAQLHDNLKIVAGSYLADYYTQGAFDYGDDFRISLCVDGKHFNKLPEGTPSERAIKRHAALALFTPVFYTMLTGRPFNHDDHGDNNAVIVDGKTIHVGKFDSGAQALTPPTTEQKIVFANCLVDALANSAKNKYSPLSSLKHTIAKASADLGPGRQDDLDYINSMMRASVSLGDYMRYLKPKDYMHAFLAVAQTGEIDPVILSRMAERVTAMGVEKAQRLPIIGPIARGLAGLSHLSGMDRCSLSQQLAASLRQEQAHAARFYPNNPNPNRGQKKQAATTSQLEEEDVEKEFKGAIPVRIKGVTPDQPLNFRGRILGAAARAARPFIK